MKLLQMINPFTKLTKSTTTILGVSGVVVFFTLWSIISYCEIISTTKLPSPLQIANAFTYLLWHNGNSMLLEAAYASFVRVVKALFFVVSIGIPIGVAMGSSPKINAILSPLVDPFRSAPITAFLPLLLMWFGLGETMKIIFLFLGAVFYLIPLVRDAIKDINYTYWEVMIDLGATPFEALTKAVIPIAAPRIFDSIIVSMSILWTYITVAEYVNAESGLGQLIQNAKRFSALDQMIVGIITIIVFALISNKALEYIKSKLFAWNVTS